MAPACCAVDVAAVRWLARCAGCLARLLQWPLSQCVCVRERERASESRSGSPASFAAAVAAASQSQSAHGCCDDLVNWSDFCAVCCHTHTHTRTYIHTRVATYIRVMCRRACECMRVCVCVCGSVVDLFSCCTYMQLYQIANNRLAGTSECVLEMNKNYSFCAKTLQPSAKTWLQLRIRFDEYCCDLEYPSM